MSFHPNDIRRRGHAAMIGIVALMLFLTGGFFRSQVLQHAKYTLQAETNRLRELPLPAPRGVIYDRNNKIIADNAIGYSVSVLVQREDSLRSLLSRLSGTISLTQPQIDQTVRRFRRAPGRPAVILPDAAFDVVSVLEEHRTQFPGLIIESSPRRFYPDGALVAPFVGYTGEISENELTKLSNEDYKAGQQIGKQGLEKQYEAELRGKEGSQFVEVDARGRIVRQEGARADLQPVAGPPLYTIVLAGALSPWHWNSPAERWSISSASIHISGCTRCIPPRRPIIARHFTRRDLKATRRYRASVGVGGAPPRSAAPAGPRYAGNSPAALGDGESEQIVDEERLADYIAFAAPPHSTFPHHVDRLEGCV